jgi:bacterioferritin (cytochrome b1)
MSHQDLITLTADEILQGLNRALLAERQAVADYQTHAQASDRADIQEALETLRDVEREHALRLSLRITALGGTPTSRAPEPQPAGDTLASWLARDLEGEQWAIVEYARLVAGIMDDDATAGLMAELLQDEISHAAWLKSTLRALATGG